MIVEALQDSQISSLVITLLAGDGAARGHVAYERRRSVPGVNTIALLLVVLWTFGMMAAAGFAFGSITATTAAVAIGIGLLDPRDQPVQGPRAPSGRR